MPARFILGIETSNPSAWTPTTPVAPGVALGTRDSGAVHLLGREPVDPAAHHSDLLMAAIARLCDRFGVRPRDIARICVSAGPGGYTAVRLGITTAKLIAESTGAQVVAVPTAMVAAWNAPVAYPLGVALASKGESTHVSVFPTPGVIARAAVMSRNDLESLGLRALVADRFLPETFRAQVVRLGIDIVPPVFDPAACLHCAEGLEAVDPTELAPMYPREPEAVRKWRELHPGPSPETGE